MKNLKIIVLFAGLILMTSAHAHSRDYYNQPGYDYHSYPDRIDQRQFNQHRRIERGLYSGRLAPWELEKLSRQQHRIAWLEHRFNSDGRLSWRERQILQHKLDRASRRIDHFNHNDRNRPWGDDYYGYNR
jgi:hypothetical protein